MYRMGEAIMIAVFLTGVVKREAVRKMREDHDESEESCCSSVVVVDDNDAAAANNRIRSIISVDLALVSSEYVTTVDTRGSAMRWFLYALRTSADVAQRTPLVRYTFRKAVAHSIRGNAAGDC